MYEITKGPGTPHIVPLPVKVGRPAKYPFDKMEIGDSFVLPWSDSPGDPRKKLKVAARRVGIRITILMEPSGSTVTRIA